MQIQNCKIEIAFKGDNPAGIDTMLQIRANTPREFRRLLADLAPEIAALTPRANPSHTSRPSAPALACPVCGKSVWDNTRQPPPKNKPAYKCKKCGWKQDDPTPPPPTQAGENAK